MFARRVTIKVAHLCSRTLIEHQPTKFIKENKARLQIIVQASKTAPIVHNEDPFRNRANFGGRFGGNCIGQVKLQPTLPQSMLKNGVQIWSHMRAESR